MHPSNAKNVLDPRRRAAEKAASREQDEWDLKSGAKSAEDLRRENDAFYGIRFQVDFGDAR